MQVLSTATSKSTRVMTIVRKLVLLTLQHILQLKPSTFLPNVILLLTVFLIRSGGNSGDLPQTQCSGQTRYPTNFGTSKDASSTTHCQPIHLEHIILPLRNSVRSPNLITCQLPGHSLSPPSSISLHICPSKTSPQTQSGYTSVHCHFSTR